MTNDNTKSGARHNKRDTELLKSSRTKLREIDGHLEELGGAMEAIEESVDDAQKPKEGEGKSSDTLIAFGGEVKALGAGRVGGYLIRYTTGADPDLTGDYFTKETDFGGHASSPVFYHHGLDAKLGRRVIGQAQHKPDDVGVWVEAQLNLRDEYEKGVYALAEKGKLGWSSGTASHLVERGREGKANRITRWPLGLDASLTPTPAEFRNAAMVIKSLSEFQRLETEAKADSIRADVKADATTTPTMTAPTGKGLTTMEQNELDAAVGKAVADALAARDSAEKAANARAAEVKAAEERGYAKAVEETKARRGQAPAQMKTAQLGSDDEMKAMLHYIRTGQGAGEFKASNDTDMNVGTAADGGNAVPTGFYNQITARRDESMLAALLGVTRIPGRGTTTNAPLDNEADGEFISTAEAAAFDRDAPAIGTKAFTLVKYTKKIELSYELLQDEDARLLGFLENFVGRGLAKTHNNLLVTEAANGTALKTFAAAAAIAVNEIDALTYDNDIAYYLNDIQSVGWIMRPATHGAISVLSGTNRIYAPITNGTGVQVARPMLLNYPVHFSNKVGAIAASAKSVYFGNWAYMGLYEAPGLTFLRDPYGAANTGQVRLYYYFRAVYGLLQTEAIGYGVHPSA